MRRIPVVFAIVLLALHSCTAPDRRDAGPSSTPEAARSRGGSEAVEAGAIVVCGRRFPVAAPVVLWTDPGGYDAYSPDRRFMQGGEPAARYGAREMRGDPGDLDDLRRHVDQFVIHYDAAGTSRQCFKVLHDLRGLSVHFMIDVDGTIYQTLDLKERAWHATRANGRSVGVELAHIGAYPLPDNTTPTIERSPMADWYAHDKLGPFLTIPAWQGDGGIRTAGFRGRPARPRAVVGEVQGQVLTQYDFTPEQYESLAALTATLCGVFPRLRCDYPRGPGGSALDRAMTEREFDAYRGLLGHYHVQENKVDPGPAFDWHRVVASARSLSR